MDHTMMTEGNYYFIVHNSLAYIFKFTSRDDDAWPMGPHIDLGDEYFYEDGYIADSSDYEELREATPEEIAHLMHVLKQKIILSHLNLITKPIKTILWKLY